MKVRTVEGAAENNRVAEPGTGDGLEFLRGALHLGAKLSHRINDSAEALHICQLHLVTPTLEVRFLVLRGEKFHSHVLLKQSGNGITDGNIGVGSTNMKTLPTPCSVN
eukprot:g11470.t1